MTTTHDLPSPVQIDTAIVKAQYHAAEARKRFGFVVRTTDPERYNPIPAARAKEVTEIAQGIQFDALLAAQAVETLYCGWQRWFLVNNTNGHFHTSTSCSTLFPTTQIALYPELSGTNAEDAVLIWGEAICTVCVPSAPTFHGFEDGKSDLAVWASAVKAAEKDAKAEKKAAAEATQITVQLTSERPVKTFKTERAATNFAAGQLDSARTYAQGDGSFHPCHDEWVGDVRAIAAAGVDLTKTFDNQIKKAEKAIRNVAKDAADAKARYGDAATPEAELAANRQAGLDFLIAFKAEVVR